MRDNFSPDDLRAVYTAFDTAWAAVEPRTQDHNRDAVREHVSKVIMGLARAGHRNTSHLANYGAYQGRSYIDLRATRT